MVLEVEKVLLDIGGKRRVVIYRRDDAYFELREEYWFENIYEGKLIAQGWAPRPTHPNIYESAKLAECDALHRFPALKLVPPEA